MLTLEITHGYQRLSLIFVLPPAEVGIHPADVEVTLYQPRHATALTLS